MKPFIVLLMLMTSHVAFSQNRVEKVMEVGQKIKLKKCSPNQKEFEFIDVYARTKPYDKSKVDTLSGEGLLQEFFSDKSIDAKRLPCSMGGYSYKIAAFHEFEVKGETKRVILCYTSYPLTLIWIELDKAMESGEILVD